MDAWVYVISHPSGWCKVGYSADAFRRLKQLNYGAEAELSGVAVFQTTDPEGDERIALSALSKFRITGEWFDIAPSDAVGLLSQALNRTAEEFPAEAAPSASTKHSPPLQIRVDPDIKERIKAAADRSGRSMAKEIGMALTEAYPSATPFQEGLRYGKVWGLRLLEMGPEKSARHPNRSVVQRIYDKCEERGVQFDWDMVGGRPADFEQILAEWSRMQSQNDPEA